MKYIGVDLGGTNIAAGLVGENRKIMDIISVKTALPRPAESIIEDIGKLVHQLAEKNGLSMEEIAAVGVGVPGTTNEETGCVEYANNLGFDNVPFVALLKKYVEVPVYFDNDANAAAWGEYLTGGYKEASFVMVTLGTGVGGGIVLDRKLWKGLNYAAAELGHMTIQFEGEECNCGRKGCFEAYGSATALIRQAKKAMKDHKDSLLWELCEGNSDKIEAKSVFDGCRQGDKLSQELFDNYTTYLAIGIANIINLLQPEVLCIGGGVSKAGEMLLQPIKEKTAAMIYSKNAEKNTEICLAKTDNDAGIIGAALLGMEINQ